MLCVVSQVQHQKNLRIEVMLPTMVSGNYTFRQLLPASSFSVVGGHSVAAMVLDCSQLMSSIM